MSRLMDGIVFGQGAFLALMDAVNANELVGFDADAFIPPDQAQHRQLILDGLEVLSAENYVQKRDDSYAISGDLAAMAMALAHPEVVTLITRDEATGTRLFGHYQRGRVIMEFTLPAPNEYRMAAIPNTLASLQRTVALLELTHTGDEHQFEVEQGIFFEVKRLVEQGERDAAARLLHEEEIDSADFDPFLDSLQNPQFGGQIAMLHIDNQTITDGRNVAVVQGDSDAWLIYQTTPGITQLTITTASDTRYQQLLGEYHRAIMTGG